MADHIPENETLDRLNRRRGANHGVVTRFFTAMDAIRNNAETRQQKLAAMEMQIQLLNTKLEFIKLLDARILNVLPDAEIEGEIEVADQYHVDAVTKRLDYEAYMLTLRPETAQDDDDADTTYTSARGGHRSSKLPEIKLPHFSGNILKWSEFWDAFQAEVDSDPDLPPVTKFNYLRGQLSGDAFKKIAGFSVNNANYPRALEKLKETFGKPNRIINAHFRALAALPSTSDTLSSLRTFIDTLESHVRSLESLGKEPDSFGALLVCILLDKIHPSIRQNLIRSREFDDDDDPDEWSLEELCKAIQKEITIMEIANCNQKSHSSNQQKESNGRSNQQNQRGSAQSKSCPYCEEEGHKASHCSKIKTVEDRWKVVRRNRLCCNCLLTGHRHADCSSSWVCHHCKEKHHTSLHDDKKSTKEKPDGSADSSSKGSGSATYTKSTVPPDKTVILTVSTSSSIIDTDSVLFKTAIAPVSSGKTVVDASILFDDASKRCFITSNLFKTLELQVIRYDRLRLIPFGCAASEVQTYPVVKLDVIALDGGQITIHAVVVEHIATTIRNRWPVDPSASFPHLQGLKLARQVDGNCDFSVDILIGLDYYYSFINGRTIHGVPVAVESRLGFLLAGPTGSTSTEESSVSSFHIGIEEEFDMSKFWTLESLGILPEVEQKSNWVEDFKERNIYFKDGRFYSKLPFKNGHPPLDTNLNICQARTRQMVRRISKNGSLLRDYSEILQNQLDRGYIEFVDETTPTPKSVHFINHHPVLKPQSLTTPIRIVYDCSGRSKTGVSINDCLDEGPALQNDMLHILLRFRLHKYGLFSDIEKAFHQIMLEPTERDLFRFLYLSNPEDPESRFRTLRHVVLPFGANCSPFILAAVIQKLLDAQPSSEVVKLLQRDLYVDNLVTGCSSKEEAVDIYNESRRIMESAQFNLRIWNSNDPQVFRAICPDGVYAEPPTTKVLGLLWDTKEDRMYIPSVQLSQFSSPTSTKRDVAKGIASIFDPMGLLSPVTIRGKLLIKQLWIEKHEWDKPLPEPLIIKWTALCRDLEEATSYNIKRCYLPSANPVRILHVFVDASKAAYGASVYVSDGTHSSLVVAKVRAAPIQARTLPELELLAAYIGTLLATTVLKAIVEEGSCIQVHMWSDAQVVLYWLQSKKKLPIFVANRVQEINKFSKIYNATWHYCPTKDNPADLLTRGISCAEFLSASLWETGPSWLHNPSLWPEWPPATTVATTIVESESVDVLPFDPVGNVSKVIEITRFSKLSRLIRTTASMYRVISNCRNHQRNKEEIQIYSTKDPWKDPSPPLSAREVLNARKKWISSRQQEAFGPELAYLRSSSVSRTKPAMVRQLDLILRDGLICCGGRFQHSEMAESAKHPILLSKTDYFTQLIIWDFHWRASHSGVSATVAALRQVFWIPSARQVVRKTLRKCVKCTKVIGRPYESPGPAPLPAERVRIQPPFHGTGIDLTGALHVKPEIRGGAEKKVYIALFTCTASRAIHLEVVEDLSAKEFLDALRRFSNRRSTPAIIISDNATNFESSAETIKRLMSSPEVTNFCSDRGIKWKFITKRAPWHGGFWERLIGLTKTTLRKVLGRRRITAAELRTLITDVEAAMNDRPLTYVSPDHLDAEPITPSHLIYGRRIIPFPIEDPPNTEDPDYIPNLTQSDLSKQALKQKELGQQLWNRWMTEYLSSLREFHQASTGKKEVIQQGDVVLVHDEKPRLQWQMAIVESIIKSTDGKVRSVNIRTAGGRTNRSIEKLYPLEVRVCAPNDASSAPKIDPPFEKEEEETGTPQPEAGRPIRKAKVAARKKIAGWTASDKEEE